MGFGACCLEAAAEIAYDGAPDMAGRRTSGWLAYAASPFALASATDAASIADGSSTSAPSRWIERPDWGTALSIRPMTVGANKRVKQVRVSFIEVSTDAPDGKNLPGALVQYDRHMAMSAATATSGSRVPVAGSNVATTSNYVGDIGTLTIATYGSKKLNMVNGSADVYSTDNDIGEILISDVSNVHGVVVDFVTATAASATLANAQYKWDA